MTKIPDHTLKADLDIILKDITSRVVKNDNLIAFRYWPVACGAQLSAVTTLRRIDEGVLKVSTTSSSAKMLLLLKKNEIIGKYQENYPELDIVDLQIVKRA